MRRDPVYDEIGHGYADGRGTDPKLAARIWTALGDARTVLNVGAGTGSYEPPDRDVTAVEPSRVMRDQRSPGTGPCIDAAAENLPFPDRSFDAAMAINAELLQFEEAELGARLLTADTRPRPSRRKVPHDPPTPPSPGRERT